MSEVRLVIRGAEGDWSGTIHGSSADRAIAALSADPVTLEELEVALGRYEQPRPEGKFFGGMRSGIDDEPYDAGLVVIDLVGRVIVVESTYSYASRSGMIAYHNGKCCTEHHVPFRLDEDWQISSYGDQWRGLSESRRREKSAQPLVDSREVLYGKPLIESLVREVFAACSATPPLPLKEPAVYDDEERQRRLGLHRRIHAAWLLTPRDDLAGKYPRAAALDGHDHISHDHISHDHDDRCMHWTILGQPAPGVSATSHAFRYGSFGSHEWFKYYDLVRELLWSCHERIYELIQLGEGGRLPEAFLVGDFLTTEVPRLTQVRDQWLDFPDFECHGRTPCSIIDRERRRIPESISGHEAMVDADCPCCQMLAEMPGPTFWHLDGCNNDDEFAFDPYCKTVADWDAKQREYEEMDRCIRESREERLRMGVDYEDQHKENSPWSRSFSLSDDSHVPLGIRIFGIGCSLAEVICDVRNGADRDAVPPERQQVIDRLNRHFGNLRDVLPSPDLAEASALLSPVIDRFRETLDEVAELPGNKRLSYHCESLAGELDRLLRPNVSRQGGTEPDSWDDLPF